MHACTRMLAFSCAGLPTAPNTPHRTIVSELSQLQRADGSAKWAQENTCVLAAVYGPRLAPPRKEDAERAVVEVVFKPRSGIQGERRTREAQPPLAVWCLAWAWRPGRHCTWVRGRVAADRVGKPGSYPQHT